LVIMKTMTSAKGPAREYGLSQTGPGLTMVDAMLEILGRRQARAAVNAALDLRLLLSGASDGPGILRGFFHLRDIVGDDL
jgi:hypothetical protein